MTFSDAELVRLWPRVPDTTCSACGYRGECTVMSLGPTPLCDLCLWVKFGADDEPMPVLRADIEMTTGGST